jgi:hypothetical protein
MNPNNMERHESNKSAEIAPQPSPALDVPIAIIKAIGTPSSGNTMESAPNVGVFLDGLPFSGMSFMAHLPSNEKS